MKLADQMKVTLPISIKNQCRNFLTSYKEINLLNTLPKYIHDGQWKEPEKDLKKITKGILNIL